MNPARTAKCLALYESGLLSANEVANSLLHELVSETEIDMAFVSSFDSLPEEVRYKFLSKLRKIQEADYHWIPFMLSTLKQSADSTKYSAQLRKLCALFL